MIVFHKKQIFLVFKLSVTESSDSCLSYINELTTFVSYQSHLC